MPRKCGLCKKEGHNKSNCENAHYKGEYNYKGERHGKGTYEYKLSKYKNTTLEGAKYEGCWVDGKREFEDGSLYKGTSSADFSSGITTPAACVAIFLFKPSSFIDNSISLFTLESFLFQFLI